MVASSALKKATIACVQLEYGLMERSIEKAILPYCVKEGIAVLAYRPLGHGALATSGSKLEALCTKYSRTPSQIALRWLSSRPNVVPIPRASTPAHVSEDLGASGWSLRAEDVLELDTLFPAPAGTSE